MGVVSIRQRIPKAALSFISWNGFEDNISKTDMVRIVGHNGKPVFWGSFDELIAKLSTD